MAFHINLTPNAADDFDYFDAYAQRIIMAAVHTYLVHNAHIPTKLGYKDHNDLFIRGKKVRI